MIKFSASQFTGHNYYFLEDIYNNVVTMIRYKIQFFEINIFPPKTHVCWLIFSQKLDCY